AGLVNLPAVHASVGEHVGLEYIAAVWRRIGVEVRIWEAPPGNDVTREVAEAGLDILGFSPFHTVAPAAFNMARAAKEACSRTHVVFGGVWSSFNAERILDLEPAVDSVCVGEGEDTAAELVEALRTGSDLSAIRGLVHRKDGHIVRNPGRPLRRDLDSLPFPARDMLAARLHLRPSGYIAQVSTSRGCTGTCTFCCINSICRLQGGPAWRGRSPENVVSELEILATKHGGPGYFFTDGDFLDPGRMGRERARTIARLMVERRVVSPFFAFMRSDDLCHPEGERTLELLCRAGLRKVYLGVESGSPETLRLYGKRATREHHVRAIELLRAMGVPVEIGYILMHPWATTSEIRENTAFLKDVGQAHLLSNMCVTVQLYNGAALTARAVEDGLLEADHDIMNPLAYRFLNPSIKKLSVALTHTAYSDWAKKLDMTLKHLDTWLTLSRPHARGDSAKTVAGVQALLDRAAEANLRFMARSCDLADTGWSPEAYREIEAELRRVCETIMAEAASMALPMPGASQ
ncbi:MAG: B12-binding domain-containing radical SAM protein, partial [Firmicutes bacterium]|nr:B12-binding domain-containing radical SAM protein [Bacillota bacterium]